MANAGVPATVFLVLADEDENLIDDASVYQQTSISAQLQLLDANEIAATIVPISLLFSQPDDALVGSYTPPAFGLYYLQVTVGAEIVAGVQLHNCQDSLVEASISACFGIDDISDLLTSVPHKASECNEILRECAFWSWL